MKPSKPQGKGRPRKPRPRRRPVVVEEQQAIELPAEPLGPQPGTGPRLSAGDVDADWKRAESTGEETVGGSVATPDQDVVDEIGGALGVEREAEAELTTSAEMLQRRDRFRWHLEYDAEARERQEEDRRDREARER
jgi:Family of unknown function (DUF6335)